MFTKTKVAFSPIFIILLIIAGISLFSSYPNKPLVAAEKKVQKTEKDIVAEKTSSIYKLSTQFAKADKAEKDKLLSQLKTAAKERKILLKSLIQKNPKDAAAVLFDNKVKKIFPQEIQDYLEEETTVQGKYEVYHADDFINKKSQHFHFIKTDKERISLFNVSSNDP